MFVGDEEPAASMPDSPAGVPEPPARIFELPARLPDPPVRVPEPPAHTPPTPPEDVPWPWFRDLFALPPEVPEGQTPAPPATEPEPERRITPVGCVVVLVLAVVSGFVETIFPLDDRQKYLGMGAVAVGLMLMQLWMDLHDSDLAYRDRNSRHRLARLRDRLRELLNIPVI